MDLQGNIKVFLRMKADSASESKKNYITIKNQTQLLCQRQLNLTTFTFDHIFDHTQHNYAVYQKTVQPLIINVLQGQNANVLFYGQTASGKTFTMQGEQRKQLTTDFVVQCLKKKQYNNIGIILYSMLDLFKEINKSEDNFKYVIQISYFEIYNENVYDLLSDNIKESLQVLEDPKSRKFYTKGIIQQPVDSLDDVFYNYRFKVCRLLNFGESNRHFSSTVLNHCSSRSHALFTVDLIQFDGEKATRQSKLTFIDLAGCEKIENTQTIRNGKECQAINKSLFCLTRLLHLRGQKSQNHIPYRDSILTKIIKPTLDDFCLTHVVLFMNPTDEYLEQNFQTLQFGINTKQVHSQNIRKRQESQSDIQTSMSDDMQDLLAKLKGILKQQQSKKILQNNICTNAGILMINEGTEPVSTQAAKISDILFDYEGKFYKQKIELLVEENQQLRLLIKQYNTDGNQLRYDLQIAQECLQKQQKIIQEQKAFIDQMKSNSDAQNGSPAAVNFSMLLQELSMNYQPDNTDSVSYELAKLLDDVESKQNPKRKTEQSLKTKPQDIEQSFNHPSTTKKNQKLAFDRPVRSPLQYFNQYRCNYKPRSLSYKSSGKKNKENKKINKSKQISQFEVIDEIQQYSIKPQKL